MIGMIIVVVVVLALVVMIMVVVVFVVPDSRCLVPLLFLPVVFQ